MSNKGFTLIELMIALVILAVGSLSIGGMQITSVMSNTKSNHVGQATAAAQDKLEHLRNLPFDDGELEAGNHHEESDVSGTPFIIDYGVEALGTSGKTIAVTVQWTEATNNHSISLSTIKAE